MIMYWRYAFVGIVLLLSAIVLYYRIRVILFTSPNAIPPVDFCSNPEAIAFMQRQQWLHAKTSLFGSANVGSLGEDEFDFYKRSFGASEVILGPNPKNLTALTYYRIFKNGNDNIRSLLMEYAHHIDGQEREYQRQNCTFKECLHRRFHALIPAALKSMYFPSHHRRYAFTFTREPIERFISAITEVEYRAKTNLLSKGDQPITPLPLEHPLGSPLRFMEFIKFILISAASPSFFRTYAGVEIAHIAPQIGTVVLATRIEADDFHIYRLDRFNEYWTQIANDTKLSQLEVMKKRRKVRDWPKHPSSDDPYQSTLAARSFFSYASTDAFHRYGANIADHIRQPVPPGYTATEYQRLAKQYLRAVCRVYLVDYICLNYTLPADCQSLTQEAQDSIREFQRISVEQIQYTERSLFDNMRGVLPQAYMRIVAAFACLTTESPECESSIVHGDSILDVVERHDEL